MRKLLLAAVATAVAVAGSAVFATAATGPGDTSWSFGFNPNKVNRAAGTTSTIEPAVRMSDNGTPDDESDDTYAKTKKTTIFFPKGSSVDTRVPNRCKATGGKLASTRGSACSKAQIGSGNAISIVGEARLAATIKAYNKKNGIYFLIQPCQPGTGPGQANSTCTPLGNPFVLEGKWGWKDRAKTIPRLVVPTPKVLLDNNIIIQRFSLKTNKVTKRRTINGRRVLTSFSFTPRKCKGKWTSSARMQYTNRSPLTIKATQACRK